MNDVDDPMAAEFDTVAGWTAQAARALGPEYFIPAGCRGSGQPAALDWLLAGLAPQPRDLMFDVGAGMGGPAAYARERTGARLVLAEPEPGACRAAAALFDLPVVEADATALPFADEQAGLAWCLGVLCTATGPEVQLAMLRELRRIVRPAGRIGLLVYLAVTGQLDDPPEGNHFPSSGQLNDLIGAAGLEVTAAADSAGMPPPSPDWHDRTAQVERELERRCGQTPQVRAAHEQSHRIGRLLHAGQLTAQVILLRRPWE